MLRFCLILSMCLAGVMGRVRGFISSDDLIQQIMHNQTLETESENRSEEFSNLSNREDFRHQVMLGSFPSDFMSEEVRLRGGIVVHLCLFIYLCLVLAVIIDSYFIKSLQYFSLVFGISPNVSGSTLMAFGTSSPEFFTSIVSVFLGGSNIATGAIVGSSIVNTLAIPGICGIALPFIANQYSTSKVSSYSVLHDLLFFAITAIIFILSIKDNAIDWAESVAFLFMYAAYIFSLYSWSNIRANKRRSPIKRMGRRRAAFLTVHQSTESIEKADKSSKLKIRDATQFVSNANAQLEDYSCIKWLLLPVLVVVRCTIPPVNRSFFVISFFMCCVWIAALTYFNLYLVSIIGRTFHMSEVVIGMTILALGTNLPELISSFIIVRKHQLSAMALCHTIGSNIFNILVCLGLPWFLRTSILTIREGTELSELGHTIIPLEGGTLSFVCLSLLISILALSLILYLTNWRLTFCGGILCLAAYGTYILIVLVMQLNSLL